MEILIKSRDEIEKYSMTPYQNPTAVISITDYDYSFATLQNMPKYLLQIEFDDIDNDVFIDELGRTPLEPERKAIENKYHMLTDEKAKEIADFYKQVRNEVEIVICQCEHGQSRSAGVAAAILEYETGKGIDIFADDKYYPNKVVYRKIVSELQRI